MNSHAIAYPDSKAWESSLSHKKGYEYICLFPISCYGNSRQGQLQAYLTSNAVQNSQKAFFHNQFYY